jgi:hypothetical protein
MVNKEKVCDFCGAPLNFHDPTEITHPCLRCRNLMTIGKNGEPGNMSTDFKPDGKVTFFDLFQKTLEDIYLGKTIICRHTGKHLLVKRIELDDGYDGFEINFFDHEKKKAGELEFAFISNEMPEIAE